MSLVCLAAALTQTTDPEPSKDQAAFFESKIRPVLVAQCLSCHGPTVQMVGLRLDNRAGLLKGGASGAAIVPGDPEKSLFIHAIRQTGPIKMPKGGKLKPTEIADLEAWIKMGAPWPSKSTSKPTAAAGVLWSLKPVVKPPVPTPKNVAWMRNPIDAFILAKLESQKLGVSPQADRRTLIRRLTYDLTGLPPSAADVDAFLADSSPAAYDKVVDRLLASPQYGERWARLWLDVARYADTKGYVFEEDRNYYNAYTYRDWVIRAFNQDLPYDQFILQQLAADRLPEVANGEDKRPLAALGFLTVGRRFLNNPPDIIDDRIDVTMRGFQGFTVACARCHDHKFDPIPTQDYYSLYAVFASSLEREDPISEKSIRDPWELYRRRLEVAEGRVRDQVLGQIKALREKVKSPSANVSAEAKQALQMLREGQIPTGDNFTRIFNSFDEAERNKLQQFIKELDDVKRSAPPLPEFAMSMTDRPNPSDGVIFKRGNPNVPGDAAPRRFLAALAKPGAEREHWKNGSGRLELARAIASKDNPLTARVFVNRVWQGHFGAGLVRTPSDFGHQGDRPTHPELLDYLAATFTDSGWSIKKLHRLIVTSATYRQASTASKVAHDADPDNRYLGRMNRRRLDLEQMRDSLMAASGRLDIKKVGGKSTDLWAPPYSPRRALYGQIERQNLPGIFRTFDFASPDISNPRRFQTTVPQQALFFMNSPFSIEQARSLVGRKEVLSSQSNQERIRQLYRILFARTPDSAELAAGLAYLKAGSAQAMVAPSSEWRYGYGSYDPVQRRVTQFSPFKVFADGNYRVGRAFPDPELGYLMLNGVGGHPGRDENHTVIRRWVAPRSMTIEISGSLHHPQSQGDGVRGRVVSSRTGILGEWQAQNKTAKTTLAPFEVQKGETIDFVVDCLGNEGYDAFGWTPEIRTAEGQKAWNAATDFGPPPPPALTRLELYAQALMMTNEFLFVD